jgi:hypothetical protein
MAHTKGAARTKHKAECKAYKDSGTEQKNRARKQAKLARHLAKAKVRREKRETAANALPSSVVATVGV